MLHRKACFREEVHERKKVDWLLLSFEILKGIADSERCVLSDSVDIETIIEEVPNCVLISEMKG